MSNQQHTLGPWNCNRDSAAGRNIVVSEVAPLDICVLSNRDKTPAEIDANANLIAAAPQLLAALEACEAALRLVERETGNGYAATINARTAIAKAKGEPSQTWQDLPNDDPRALAADYYRDQRIDDKLTGDA